MRTSAQAFLDSPNKRVTLLGMSGVGKTRLANLMRDENWFHYSVDYRIGTRYLDEPILDNIKVQAMQVPFLRELLRTDSIYIGNNITFENLKPLSSFLGMLGNPDKDGLPLPEFKRRQKLHLDAEIAAMRDVPSFIDKAQTIYGYTNFLNDASGSFCEIDDASLFEQLAEQTLFIYIKADAEDEQFLIERAAREPKPLYYRDAFLDEQLLAYQQEKNLSFVTEIDPPDFITWVFPKLFKARVPRYKAIAEKYGYTVSARDAFAVQSADDFVTLIAKALN
jgi:hypothetical protein